MFKFRTGSKIEKSFDANSSQLNLYKEFDAADQARDIATDLYNSESDREDKEREEEMIQETLTRSIWEEKNKEDNLDDEASRKKDWESYREWESKNGERVLAEINKAREDIKSIAGDTGEDDLEEDKPGYELYGRFAKFIDYSKSKNKSKK